MKIDLFCNTLALLWPSLVEMFSCQVVSNFWGPHKLQHARLPWPLPSPWVCSNMSIESVMPSYHVTLCCPLAFNLSQHQGFFQWVGSSHQVATYWSFSFSISPWMNFQGWFPLELTGLILVSKGFPRAFSITTVHKHQFFSAQPSLWSNIHIHTWLLEKP